jgi:tetratricopeptide (TPR) repeat protein
MIIDNKGDFNMPRKKVEEVSVFDKVQELKRNKSWNEIIELIDLEMPKYVLDREQEGSKCCQFIDILEYVYHSSCHTEDPEMAVSWVGNQEIRLMNEKAIALKHLSRYDEAEALIDEMIELAPSSGKYYLMKAEIAKLRDDVIGVARLIEVARDYLWRSNEFATYLSYQSWISLKNERYNDALAYTSLALAHNHSSSVKEYANNILNKVREATGDYELEIMGSNKVIEYFENNEVIVPSEVNIRFAHNIYEYAIENPDMVTSEEREFTRKNLILILKGNKFAPKMVEIEATTSNKLYIMESHNFAFQVSKEYKKTDNENIQMGRLFEFNNGTNSIFVESFQNVYSDEQHYAVIDDLVKAHEEQGMSLINREKLYIKEELLLEKFIYEYKNGEFSIMYVFKMNPTLTGRVFTMDTNPQSNIESELINIINNWEYIE